MILYKSVTVIQILLVLKKGQGNNDDIRKKHRVPTRPEICSRILYVSLGGGCIPVSSQPLHQAYIAEPPPAIALPSGEGI
jgi:hypothetical protein